MVKEVFRLISSAAILAAVIIGAAMTNVQKLKGAHQRQQAYNSVKGEKDEDIIDI